jgi:DNA-binding response OmpR family regulator
MGMRVLLVEDEGELARRTSASLTRHGITCEAVPTGEDALAFALDGFDVLLVDLGLPGMSGIALVREIRSRGLAAPILILTARSGWREKVEGLNAGADDFIVKPVRIEELVARLHALARRAAGTPAPLLSAGAIALDPATKEAWLGGAPLALTGNEFRLLRLFLLNTGRVLTRDTILDRLYPLESERDPNTVEVLIGRLRRKIGRERVVTLRGLGYRLAA